MEYQVWTHDEYEGWFKVDCGDIAAAQREILGALTRGKEPLLTVTLPYDFNVKIKEGEIGAIKKGKTESDKDPGLKGKGKVRPGDTEPVQELGEGSGDNSPSDPVPGK